MYFCLNMSCMGSAQLSRGLDEVGGSLKCPSVST